MNPSQTLIITQPNGQSYLSKEQQTFNKFIKQIGNKKKKLKEFQNLTLLYKQKYITDFEPLRKQYTECRKNFLFLLDQQYSQKILNKNDRSKLGFLICEMAESLMGTEGQENIKNIYNKYSDIDFDEHLQQEKDFMMSMMEDILDIEFDQDLDLDSPENIMEHVSQKLKEKQEKNQKKSKKTSKQLEKESEKETESQNINQSIREIYRKLASALHPDREQDVEEQERKKNLMQRVNVAYKNKDLFQLLELQLEIEQIDKDMIYQISEDRLKHYNKTLKDQICELNIAFEREEFMFRTQFEVFGPPKSILRELEDDIRDTQKNIIHIEKDLEAMQNIKNLRHFLRKEMREPMETLF